MGSETSELTCPSPHFLSSALFVWLCGSRPGAPTDSGSSVSVSSPAVLLGQRSPVQPSARSGAGWGGVGSTHGQACTDHSPSPGKACLFSPFIHFTLWVITEHCVMCSVAHRPQRVCLSCSVLCTSPSLRSPCQPSFQASRRPSPEDGVRHLGCFSGPQHSWLAARLDDWQSCCLKRSWQLTGSQAWGRGPTRGWTVAVPSLRAQLLQTRLHE